MADQKCGFAIALFAAGKVCQLRDQVRPVVGDRVLRVVPEHLDRIDLKPALAQVVEHHFVSAGRKAVAMRKNEASSHQISFSSGVVIFFSRALRAGGTISGMSVAPPCHMGSSMLSNIWRSLSPQLERSIWK